MTQEEKEKIFNDNYNLVKGAIIGHWCTSYLPAEDIEQEAAMALWDCIEDFDCKKKIAFSTFVYHAVRWQLTRYAYKCLYGGTLPECAAAKAGQIISEAARRQVSVDTICKEQNITGTLYTWAKYMRDNLSPLSLNASVASDGDCTELQELLQDPCNLEEDFQRSLDTETVVFVYREFPKYVEHRHRSSNTLIKCIEPFLNYIFSNHKCTLQQTSDMLKISRQYISKCYCTLKQDMRGFIKENLEMFTDTLCRKFGG